MVKKNNLKLKVRVGRIDTCGRTETQRRHKELGSWSHADGVA